MLPSRSSRSRQLGFAGSFFALGFACCALAADPKSRAKQSPPPRPEKTKSPTSLASVPLPVGQEAKGLVLPDFDIQGRMRGRFEAAVAKRTDADHMQFTDLKMTTYTPENAVDLLIEMPHSLLDLNTRVMISNERTTVQRHDFNISGDAVQFDTVTHKGTLKGNVKMVITDQSQFMKKPGG